MSDWPVDGVPEAEDDGVVVVVAAAVLGVGAPVRHVQLGRARDHQLQLARVERRHQPRVHHLPSSCSCHLYKEYLRQVH